MWLLTDLYWKLSARSQLHMHASIIAKYMPLGRKTLDLDGDTYMGAWSEANRYGYGRAGCTVSYGLGVCVCGQVHG